MACLQSFCSLLARDACAPSSSLASSSSPAFSSISLPYPCLSCSRTPAAKLTICALSDNDKQDSSAPSSSIWRGLLAGVVAAGAALAVFSDNASMAAIGPGNEGNRRTAEKADELLKAADKLNNEDAPKRYGPGRPGPVQDPTKISQIAGSGSGATSQQGASDEGEKGKLENATSSAIGQAQSKQGQFGAAAKDAIGQADITKKNYIGDDLGKAEGGVLKPFQQGLKNLRDTVERTGADARSSVADVVSKNTP